MKVRVHPGDERGVGFQRLTWPARAAAREGVEVEIADGLPIVRAWRKTNGRQVIAPGEIDADVLVFQRPSNPEIVRLIPALQARGYVIVVDVDDDLHSLPTSNVAYGAENPQLVLKACALADLVTVSTPALVPRYGSHGRVIVLRNCVPEAILDMPRASDGRTVGWGGFTGTHPGDLASTYGGVAEAVRRTDARFHVVGPPGDVQQQLALDETPTATGSLTGVLEYERALGELDVGIVPLADTKFNASKSWLKGLQMCARGVAVVASPRPEYRVLAAEGGCVLAGDRARNWRSRVSELLEHDGLRAETAARGREFAATQTYEKNGWRWAEAWEAAWMTVLMNRRAGVA